MEIASTNHLDIAYLTRWAAELDVTDDLEDLLDTTRMTNDD